MTADEFKAAKATMPWSDRWLNTPRGGLLQIIDRNGQEVPFTVMCAVLRTLTQKLAQEPTNQGAPT